MTTMSAVETDQQLQQIRKWLLGRERNAGMTDIGVDVDLIDTRILDSLDFLNFVCLLEEITNRELSIDATTAKAFRTLRSIHDNILMQ